MRCASFKQRAAAFIRSRQTAEENTKLIQNTKLPGPLFGFPFVLRPKTRKKTDAPVCSPAASEILIVKK